jgi:hypothetical protein
LHARSPEEEVIDSQHLRSYQRSGSRTGTGNRLSKPFSEECHGTPVRKDKAQSFDISPAIIMVSNLFKERLHVSKFYAKITFENAKPWHNVIFIKKIA